MVRPAFGTAFAAFRERWLARRDELRRRHALVDGAEPCDALLDELTRLLQESDSELLSLTQAAAQSGYSPDHLGRLVRAGIIPNAGRPHAPRIRCADLPRKADTLPTPPILHTINHPKRRVARACVTLSSTEERHG